MLNTRILFATAAFAVFLICPLPAQADRERLALDAINDFAQFFHAYKELDKQEQLLYLALPFTIVRLLEAEDELEEKITIYATHTEIEQDTAGWIAIVPAQQQLEGWILARGQWQTGEEEEKNTEEICLAPSEESACLVRYTFKKIDGAWRLIQYYSNEAGI